MVSNSCVGGPLTARNVFAIQKEVKIEEGHLMKDHVHMLLSVPPKYPVSKVVGLLKGKSAITIAKTFGRG